MIKKLSYASFILILIVAFGVVFWIKSENTSKVDLVKSANINFDVNNISGSATLSNNTKDRVELKVLAMAQNQKKELPVYFYLDKDYPIVAANTTSYYGVLDFLSSYLSQKGFDRSITTVSAAELPSLLERGPAILVACSGVLPDTIYDKGKNLLTPWLKNGGQLFWVGDGIGYYYGLKNQPISSADSPTKIGWLGQEKIFGTNLIDGPFVEVADSTGTKSSQLAEALGIRYRLTRTGALVDEVLKNGGLPLGFEQDISGQTRDSLSLIPIGTGQVILFGNGVMDMQRDIAWDISQILSSGILESDAKSYDFKTVDLEPGQESTINLNTVNTNYPYLKLIVFSNKEDINYYYQNLFTSNQ